MGNVPKELPLLRCNHFEGESDAAKNDRRCFISIGGFLARRPGPAIIPFGRDIFPGSAGFEALFKYRFAQPSVGIQIITNQPSLFAAAEAIVCLFFKVFAGQGNAVKRKN
ncbi:MAG: hypothetical protein K4571_15975 [Deltaproteobacteria bacterium]